MPAATNSSVGSSRISDALGTTLWSRPSKWARNLLRISAVSIGDALSFRSGGGAGGVIDSGRGLERCGTGAGDGRRLGFRQHAVVAGAGSQLAEQLSLACAGGGGDLVGEHAGSLAQ